MIALDYRKPDQFAAGFREIVEQRLRSIRDAGRRQVIQAERREFHRQHVLVAAWILLDVTGLLEIGEQAVRGCPWDAEPIADLRHRQTMHVMRKQFDNR